MQLLASEQVRITGWRATSGAEEVVMRLRRRRVVRGGGGAAERALPHPHLSRCCTCGWRCSAPACPPWRSGTSPGPSAFWLESRSSASCGEGPWAPVGPAPGRWLSLPASDSPFRPPGSSAASHSASPRTGSFLQRGRWVVGACLSGDCGGWGRLASVPGRLPKHF